MKRKINCVAKGTKQCNKRHIAIAFDVDVFNEIRSRAQKEGTSFAEQVRLLVEWGLESAETS